MTIRPFQSAGLLVLVAAVAVFAGPAFAAGQGCATLDEVQSDLARHEGARVTVLRDNSEVARAVIFMAEHGGRVPVLPDAIILMQAPLQAEAVLVVGNEACIKVQAPPPLVEKLRRAAKKEPFKDTI
jgi:hypothetical protein